MACLAGPCVMRGPEVTPCAGRVKRSCRPPVYLCDRPANFAAGVPQAVFPAAAACYAVPAPRQDHPNPDPSTGGRMYELCPETPADTPEVEALLDLCFAPGRTALSSYRLRDGVAPVGPLCLMLRGDFGALMGAIRYWPVRVAGRPVLL